MRLYEKTKNVFLSGEGKDDTAKKAFTALKTALGDTGLSAETFEQFTNNFGSFIKSAKVNAEPAADDADPNAEEQAGDQEGQTNSPENTDGKTEGSSEGAQTDTAPATDSSADSGIGQTQAKPIARFKPSSLLFAQ